MQSTTRRKDHCAESGSKVTQRVVVRVCQDRDSMGWSRAAGGAGETQVKATCRMLWRHASEMEGMTEMRS